jgi:phenylpropionate dioxygenase-like ring-hydroxylating dioxygenase large terminal subunit
MHLRPWIMGQPWRGGLRCVYHGWKFDTAGNCLDMPNLPADPGLPA